MLKRKKSPIKRRASLTLESIFHQGKRFRYWRSPINTIEDGENDSVVQAVPLEILVYILKELPFNSWFGAALVCKRWARAFSTNKNFFSNKKFVTFAMHIRPSMWGRLMDRDRETIAVPPKLMNKAFFENAAKFVKNEVVFRAITNTQSFENADQEIIFTMINGAIIEDNHSALGVLISHKRTKEGGLSTEAFLLACKCYHKFPGKKNCLPLLISAGKVDVFLRVWQISQILVDEKLHTAIDKLSRRAAFYEVPACSWYYARYALKEKKEDLLKRVLTKSTINPTAQNNAILTKSCTLGWHKIVMYLLDNGADPSVDGQEPLKRACLSNHMQVVKCLLKSPAVDPGHGTNAIVLKVIQMGYDSMAATLIAHPKVDPTKYVSPASSILCMTAKHCCPKAMEMIFKVCPDVDPNQIDHYPIRRSITQQFMNGLRILVKQPTLKLSYDEVTHILALCSYVSDTSLSRMVMKSRQFSDAFEEEVEDVIPESADENDDDLMVAPIGIDDMGPIPT
jgi:hypothetical protein